MSKRCQKDKEEHKCRRSAKNVKFETNPILIQESHGLQNLKSTKGFSAPLSTKHITNRPKVDVLVMTNWKIKTLNTLSLKDLSLS